MLIGVTIRKRCSFSQIVLVTISFSNSSIGTCGRGGSDSEIVAKRLRPSVCPCQQYGRRCLGCLSALFSFQVPLRLTGTVAVDVVRTSAIGTGVLVEAAVGTAGRAGTTIPPQAGVS